MCGKHVTRGNIYHCDSGPLGEYLFTGHSRAIFVQDCVVLLSFVNYFLKSFQGSVQMLTLENVTPYLVYESFLLLLCRQSLK